MTHNHNMVNEVQNSFKQSLKAAVTVNDEII